MNILALKQDATFEEIEVQYIKIVEELGRNKMEERDQQVQMSYVQKFEMVSNAYEELKQLRKQPQERQ